MKEKVSAAQVAESRKKLPHREPKRPERYVPKHPIRVVTAASLFDGHDAAINIMRRILQSTGAEVIHLGHNRTARDIVEAAIEEDANAIAISSYQGGHIEFFKYIVDLLRENQCAHIRVFGGGGGTITPKEIAELEAHGVAKIYSPEDGQKEGLQGLINHLLSSSERKPLEHIQWKQLQTLSEQRILAQNLTCLEWMNDESVSKSKATELKALAKRLRNKKQDATSIVVGITGTGGAGKSSLTDELILRLLETEANARIAVLAIDPTRQKTGGALLGDRLRMNSLSNSRCFMRSLATRQANLAVSKVSEDAVQLFRSANFDWIFVETGGIGQADTSIVDLCDISIYVMTSEYGASTQLEKINMLDYSDLILINKFEKAGSLDALLEVRKQFRRNHLEFEQEDPSRFPIIGTVASRFGDPGVDLALNHLKRIKNASKKRTLLENAFDPENLNIRSIVPKERVGYLKSIADEVSQYRNRVEASCLQLKHIESLDETLKSTDLNTSTRKELEGRLKSKKAAVDSQVISLLEDFEKKREAYEKDTLTYRVRDREVSVPLIHESLSHNKIRRISLPTLRSKSELLRFLLLENLPGYFPYTAGVFPLKRQGEEPKRMFAGEGTPSRTNKRFHLLCQGEETKRLSTAFDSVTLYGEDPDERPDIFGKIGESGVSVCTLEDAKKLYSGFDLCDPNVSVSMTINGPAPIILAFFFNTAIDQKTARFQQEHKRQPTQEEWFRLRDEVLKTVRGTVQADILKEDQAQNTCIFSTAFALKMMGDIQEYFVKKSVRNFYSVSISGYHIAEAGANPITQLAFTLANGFTFVEYYLARGMKIDDFAPNLSFFFSNGLDAEYTVIGRVARRIWAIAMKHLYGANDRSQKLKYHIQTSGRSLHAQEIDFNDIRTTLQALIAFSDHCNSLHTNAYDEAITTPTDESVRRAMAIQLIIAREFGLTKNENTWQGSFFVEELTDMVEQAVLLEFERLSQRGGVLGAMELQYQRNKIQEESLHYEHQKHSGRLPIVGINTFLNKDANYEEAFPENLTRASYEEKHHQIQNLRQFHQANEKQAPKALENLKKAATSGANIFESLMDAARVCSLGQITHALYEIGGEYRRSS